MGSFKERKSENSNVSLNLGNLLSNYKTVLATPSPTYEGQGGKSSPSQDLLGKLELSLGMELDFAPFSPDQWGASFLPFTLKTLKDGAALGSGCRPPAPCSLPEVQVLLPYILTLSCPEPYCLEPVYTRFELILY